MDAFFVFSYESSAKRTLYREGAKIFLRFFR